MVRPIADFITARKIERLVHFTLMDRLPAILSDGLIPRAELIKATPSRAVTDVSRPAQEHPFNCLSIEHPNYKMFYRYRCSDKTKSWVVLEFKPYPILKDSTTRFTTMNASCAGGFESATGGLKGLSAMFDGARSKTLATRFPTDVQAEVLYPKTIDASSITAICVESETDLKLAQKIADDDPFYFGNVRVDKSLFSYRLGV